MKIYPLCYLPPVFWFDNIKNETEITVDIHEHYIKQTYRNRCEIAGANGKLNLVIPVEKHRDKTPLNAIRISYRQDWQKLHWRSIESSYRRSPYFEYYESKFHPFYHQQEFEFLYEFNLQLLNVVFEILEWEKEINVTGSFVDFAGPEDPRLSMAPRGEEKKRFNFEFTPYTQVFEPKLGFIPHLSIIDRIFNCGE